jgi:serine/threonine protein kinase
MNHNIANTAVHYFNRDFLALDKFPQVQTTYDQDELTRDELYDGVLCGRVLGYGGYGVALKCKFKGESYVIKIPSSLYIDLIINSDERDDPNNELTLRDIEVNYVDQNFRHYDESVDDMKEECSNAEAILEGPLYKIRKDKLNEAGQPIKGITHEEYTYLVKELNNLSYQSGYEHWHPIIHADFDIPCILSAPADGTLGDIVNTLYNHDDPSITFIEKINCTMPKAWVKIALQLSRGMDFMSKFGQKVHVDIKPDNVLVKYKPNGEFHLWISDYGICNDVGILDRHSKQTQIRGTTRFSPPDHERSSWYDNDRCSFDLSIYQFIRTLVYCIVTKNLKSNTNQTLGRLYINAEDKVPFGEVIDGISCSDASHSRIWQSFKDSLLRNPPEMLFDFFQRFREGIEKLQPTLPAKRRADGS